MSEERTSGPATLEPREAFAELAMIMLGSEPLSAVLQQVAGLATRTVPSIDQASVTVVQGGRPSTVAFTGSLAVELDERQYQAGFGPCLDASLSGQTILVNSSDDPSPYPLFTQACRRAGVGQVLSTGMPTTHRLVGALNLYSYGEQPVDNASIELAETFAGCAAVAAANAALLHSTTEHVNQLQAAIASRAVIEQAKGLIMGQQHCTPQEAFDVLIRASQQQNRKLRDVAAALITSTQR